MIVKTSSSYFIGEKYYLDKCEMGGIRIFFFYNDKYLMQRTVKRKADEQAEE